MGPPRKIGKIWAIFGFFRPTEKMGREGPKWGGDAFLRHKKTSPTIWAERILILRTFDFWIFGVPNLPPSCSWVKNIFRNLPPVFGSPELVGTLPQALFFLQKNGPWIFGGPTIINFDVRCSVAWANQNYFPTCSRFGGPSPIILI